jgi:anaerobic magnesium-protoporphyrin IX monomethyl ester cyclase
MKKLKKMNSKIEPKFLLIYSPQIFDKSFGAIKPEGSLGLMYLAGALRDKKFEVSILDATVGNDNYTLEETFYNEVREPDGMTRIGMSIKDILKEVADYDVIGLSSIFTSQTRMVKEVVIAIKKKYPDKIIIIGGGNARAQMQVFFDAGADLICLSEAEETIVEIAELIKIGKRNFSKVEGVAGKEGFINSKIKIIYDLDELPIPAWDLVPMKKYWQIARPHGGGLKDGNVAYAPVMFSRGCPYKCHYCHISKELEGSLSGNTRKYRMKSIGRVVKELKILKDLGVNYVFIEDDSLLAKKNRAKTIFKKIAEMGLSLADVNGINLVHLCSNIDGKLGVDESLMETMAAAGFKKLQYPVESGSQRILDKYATGKLNLKKHNIIGLIKKAKQLDMEIGGNYTFGYPDETLFEMLKTFFLARKHMAAGLDSVNFMFITPFPGTQLYDFALNNNVLLPDLKLENMDWTQPSMKTKVPGWFIRLIITKGWRLVNKLERVNRIKSMSSTS